MFFQKYDYLFEKSSSNCGNVNTDAANDNWGEPVSMEHGFSIEEILDMPVIGDEIGEPKVSADKELDPNYLGEADNESHGGKIPCELFCVTGKDSDYIDIEGLY
ncbi:MAG: hypothetical protein K2O16_07565 [Lachnospiraceae bacterium]|nr:hypothetical protein [Lachnospiraceae bacterium]